MKKINLLIWLFLVPLWALKAQPAGSLDSSFDPTGPKAGFDQHVFSTIFQPDGKIIVGGSFVDYNGYDEKRLARLAPDGTVDTYGLGGANNTIASTALQPDGKIIIAGLFTTYQGQAANYITRITSGLNLDITFNNSGSGANNFVYEAVIQPDDKIIIAGAFTSYNGVGRNYIARLNSDGSLDPSFNPGAGANLAIRTISLQSDGKIIVGGHFTTFDGAPYSGIARLHTDGSLDASFNPGSGANGPVLQTALQPDGKVMVAGGFTTVNGLSRNYIARLKPNGSLDPNFDPATGANNWVNCMAIDSNGNIVIGGSFTSFNGVSQNRIARLHPDGSIDMGFNPGLGANAAVESIAIQGGSGLMIIGGAFTSYNGIPQGHISRINPDGSLDQNFNFGIGLNYIVSTTVLQPDDKVLIGGSFTNYNGTSRNYIARLNADGSLDATFNPGTGTNYEINSIALQTDGKILIGGLFTDYNGTSRNRIARLNADGSLDATFNPGTGADYWIYSIALQPDGKILIGGLFTDYNGTSRNGIARLNADGSLDATFNLGTGSNSWI